MALITLDISYTPVINYAFQQNHVPVAKKITITNTSGASLQNLYVEITSEPDFSIAWGNHINNLAIDEVFYIDLVDIKISTTFLADLTERVAGCFWVTVTTQADVLFKEAYKVDILAYDQWNGITVLPEILAAFITPNHPQIPKLIRRASAILGTWTGNPSFDEYQSNNPDRVRKQMAALYEAIAEMQIIYCTAPASFEETGQRIRLCSQIVEEGIGNCLDMSLLYAACLEAVGIKPLIVINKGHAFAGGWLVNDLFADAVNDDASLITKRAADGINDIVVVEATCLNAGSNATSFDEAVRHANNHFVKEDNFLLFIDVKRARFGGIRPLPLRMRTNTGWEIAEDKTTQRNSALPEDIFVGGKLVTVNKIDVSKQTIWERKLLDLTLRNTLLNLRLTKSAIQLLAVDTAKFEDALSNGDEFTLLPKPADWEDPLRNADIYQALNHTHPINDLVKQEFLQKRVRTYLPEAELAGSILHLYRSAKLALEENGANTLYLALGLLKWYETPTSEKPRYAPLLLFPIEIVKKSAQKGFVIRGREEETLMNITLLEMLRQDFGITIGGLDVLPKDDSGVNVKAIFSIIRQSIMSQARWDVEEHAFLGIFSFSKFILWNDIHNNADKIIKNKIVASLIAGKLTWQAEDDSALDGRDLDSTSHPLQTALPISTDSSQLQAVVNAANGKSFVLHGPPGTGKSQTITNIIATMLSRGKKVLFVAAKKAALEVVQARLDSIGIGAFCLELHSNKSKKTAVLEQLKKAAEIGKTQPPGNYQAEAERLYVLRNELNSYVTALHKKHTFGLSLFDIFSRYSQLKHLPDNVYFNTSSIAALTEARLTQWGELAEDLQKAGQLCGHPYNHPLAAIFIKQYTQQLKSDSKEAINNYLQLLKGFTAAATAAGKAAKCTAIIANREQAAALARVCDILLALPDVPASLFNIENAQQTLPKIIEVAKHGANRDGLRAGLMQQFNGTITSFEAEKALHEWNVAQQQWFLPKWLKQQALTKKLRQAKQNGIFAKADVPATLQTIIALQAEQLVIEKATFIAPVLGFLYNNGECDWNNLVTLCEGIITLHTLLPVLAGLPAIKAWRYNLAAELAEGRSAYLAANGRALTDYKALYDKTLAAQQALTALLGINFEQLNTAKETWAENMLLYATNWSANLDTLRDWYNWLQVKNQAVDAGLLPLVTAFENGGIESDNVVKQYQKGLYRSCADYIVNSDPQLASFNGILFEEKIKRFKEINSHFEKLTRQELYARLAEKVPSFTQEASQTSEIGILQKNIRNNGRATSIRKIFDAIPNLLPRLTPCMLMSPISVAQYFDTESVKFDLVIFDEASQLPTCEAVGAMARGTNVIVVGDPKQMPPTSFFSTNNFDDDNAQNEDLESILDDCMALSMPSRHLLWHYRSKHESLIAFSNSKYYDNKLLTFPSTDDITTKVTHVKVNGYYDKGKTRQNRFEALAIVDEIVRRLTDPVLEKRSIGVVTFSSAQQILVENLLNEVFKKRPEVEKKATESTEPLFIKNLENVQGDERDVILFSICYGPDEKNKMSLNFGPINRDGGWRRLNVAVSRARYEMIVYSTMGSDMIDTNKTLSKGVDGLKAFLAYAEKGKTSLPTRTASQMGNDKAFEMALAEEIKRQGYTVHTNIGCSDFRVDIGVVNPKKQSEYILGILCDGHNYFSANTSRDREIVRTDVLQGLGWNIYKVWSAEWWENPARTMSGILNALTLAEAKVDAEPQHATNSTEAKQLPEPAINNALPPVIAKPADNYIVYYEVCNPEVVLTNTTYDFLQYHNREIIHKQIQAVLDIEAPINKELLCKRVLTAWGISRTGNRVAAQLENIFASMATQKTVYGQSIFFWQDTQEPKNYPFYRIAKHETQKRDAQHLPPEEVANGIKEVLANQLSLSKDDLVKETARLFGYARIGSNVENAVALGLNVACERGFAIIINDRVAYKG